jgi:dUTP pyrophosphatase
MYHGVDNIFVEVKIVDKAFAEEFDLFKHGSEMAAGMDLRACITENVTIEPNQCVTVEVGFAAFVNDPNYMLSLYPRSGAGTRGLVLGNLTGIIDPDYQDGIKLCLWNRLGHESITISRGERVAQMVVQPKVRLSPVLVDEFSVATERGTNGFGHSGKI